MVAGVLPTRTKILSGIGANLCAAAIAAAIVLPGTARADGALPGSLGILVPADRPEQIVLATNFGMIISEDGGATWMWTCEQAATASGYLYSAGPPPRDRWFGLSPEKGLALSDDASCTWTRAGGALAPLLATDFFADPLDPDRVLAVAASREDAGIGPPSVYASSDGGTTFAPTPIYVAPAMTNVVGLEIARSNPDVIYIAAYGYPGRHPTLVRSADGGRTWTARDVEGELGANEFRILAVDPEDADRLYLRVIGPGREEVWTTPDAGASMMQGFVVENGTLSAFARLASGTVLVGALKNLTGGAPRGLGYRSTDKGATFSSWNLCPEPHILGLAERAGILYLAGDNYSDGWALAVSTDEGATIRPLATYDQVRAVRPCAQAQCAPACEVEVMAAVWPREVCTGQRADGGAIPGGPPDPVCTGDGSPDATAPPSDSGCGCGVGGAGGRGEGDGSDSLGLCFLLALVARARRPGSLRRESQA